MCRIPNKIFIELKGKGSRNRNSKCDIKIYRNIMRAIARVIVIVILTIRFRLQNKGYE